MLGAGEVRFGVGVGRSLARLDGASCEPDVATGGDSRSAAEGLALDQRQYNALQLELARRMYTGSEHWLRDGSDGRGSGSGADAGVGAGGGALTARQAAVMRQRLRGGFIQDPRLTI